MPKQRRGFAVMDPELQLDLCRRGGLKAHLIGKAHEWTSAEASAAGAKGGAISAQRRRERAIRGESKRLDRL